MSRTPTPAEHGIEKLIVEAEVLKRGVKYKVVGYGEGRIRIYVARGDAINITGGTEIKITGAVIQQTTVTPTVRRLYIKEEVVPETGARTIHITGG